MRHVDSSWHSAPGGGLGNEHGTEACALYRRAAIDPTVSAGAYRAENHRTAAACGDEGAVAT
jgi:hypothetical protein